MAQWEYAMLSDPDSGNDGVSFSHPQGATLVSDWSAALGKGLKAGESNERFLHLNLNHTTPMHVCGLLGEHGWEMVGLSTLSGGHAYWMFKRELQRG